MSLLRLLLVVAILATSANFAYSQKTIARSNNQAFTEGDMTVGGRLQLNLPTGDLGDIADPSFGFAGQFQYFVLDNVSILGTIGYHPWSIDGDGFSISTLQVTAGGRYYFTNAPGLNFYGGLDLGIYNSTIEVDVPFLGSTSDSESSLGFDFNVGATYDINTNLLFDANVGYCIIGGDTEIDFLRITAGIQYRL